MRRVMVCVLGVLLLTSACSSSEGGPTKGAKFEDVKSSVDDLAAKILPAMAGALDGEFPAVRGEFNECGVGRNNQKYTVRGELNSAFVDNAAAAEKIRAVLADAGVDATVGEDFTVKGTTGDIQIVVQPNVMQTKAFTVRTLSIDTKCHSYSNGDADKIEKLAKADYGAPVTGAS